MRKFTHANADHKGTGAKYLLNTLKYFTPNYMKNDVFIAYSRKDTWAAEALESHLQGSGLRCYRDVKSIPGSKEWMEEINEAIKACHAVVVIVSNHSAISEHVKGGGSDLWYK